MRLGNQAWNSFPCEPDSGIHSPVIDSRFLIFGKTSPAAPIRKRGPGSVDDSFCGKCPTRGTCETPCPEVEQMLPPEIRQKEIVIPDIRAAGPGWPQILRKRSRVLTTRDRMILKYLISGFSYSCMENELNVTNGALRTAISRIKQKLNLKNAM